jgi:hypothetical protein
MTKLPNLNDYVQSMLALHRIELTYNLRLEDLARGNLSHQFKSRSLTGKMILNEYRIYFPIEIVSNH